MMRIVAGLLCFCVAALLSPAWATDDTVHTVTAEGVGTVVSGDVAMARDKAIRDAQRKAVEYAVGVLVDSKTISQNFEVLSDEVYSKSSGYVQHTTLLSERTEPDVVRVTIQAQVLLAPLKEDLDRLIEQVEKPRVLFMMSVQDVGRDAPSAWWQGTVGMGKDVVDACLQQYFLDEHFVVVDHTLKKPNLRLSAAPSDQEAVDLAEYYDAEVVVIGQAVAKDAGRVANYDIRSSRAEMSARAIQVDNGHLLGSATSSAAAAHIDALTGGNQALKKASLTLAKDLTSKIMDNWAESVSGTAMVTLDIVEVPGYSDFVRFKGALKNEIRGIGKVYQRRFQDGEAKLEVDYQGTAQNLADDLALKEFGTFTVEILEASQNYVKLKISPK